MTTSSSTPAPFLVDIISVAVSLAVLCIYNIHYYIGLFRNSQEASGDSQPVKQVTLSANVAVATAWIERHLKKDDAPSVTLAIQTIRNTIIVAVFVGGYAINYSFFYMNSIYLSQDLPFQMRSIILASCLFLSFLAWASVIRLASHLGYLIGVKAAKPAVMALSEAQSSSNLEAGTNDKGNNDNNASSVSSSSAGYVKIENRNSRSKYMTMKMILSFSLGFRFMFISIPFVFYSFGCVALLVSTAFMVAFLVSIDHLEYVDLDL